MKDSLKHFDIPVDEWESLAVDRDLWWERIFEGDGEFEKARTDRLELKRACHKHEAPLPARNDVLDLQHMCKVSAIQSRMGKSPQFTQSWIYPTHF